LRELARALGIADAKSLKKGALVEQLAMRDETQVLMSLEQLKRRDSNAPYVAPAWEKICAVATAIVVVAFVGFLAVRNEPFKDENIVVLLRIVLCLAVAVIGATAPGFLQIDLSLKGVLVRAGGALALFVLTYLFAPAGIGSIIKKDDGGQPPGETGSISKKKNDDPLPDGVTKATDTDEIRLEFKPALVFSTTGKRWGRSDYGD
jgi:hypothetical protein